MPDFKTNEQTSSIFCGDCSYKSDQKQAGVFKCLHYNQVLRETHGLPNSKATTSLKCKECYEIPAINPNN